MTRYLLVLLLTLAPCALAAQAPAPVDGNSGVTLMARFCDGANVYVAGWFHGTADFDPGPGSALLSSPLGSCDVFTAAYAGNDLLWAEAVPYFAMESATIWKDGTGSVNFDLCMMPIGNPPPPWRDGDYEWSYVWYPSRRQWVLVRTYCPTWREITPDGRIRLRVRYVRDPEPPTSQPTTQPATEPASQPSNNQPT